MTFVRYLPPKHAQMSRRFSGMYPESMKKKYQFDGRLKETSDTPTYDYILLYKSERLAYSCEIRHLNRSKRY